jgi:hypothetical protein
VLDHTFGTYNNWLVVPFLGIAIAPSYATVDLAGAEVGHGTTFVIRLPREAAYVSIQERVAA